MSLQPCRECGENVSTEAGTCPRCGVSNPTGSVSGALSVMGGQGGEGPFLQTLNCGCLIVIILVLVGTCSSMGAAQALLP